MNQDYTVVLENPPAIVETDTRRSDEVRKRVQQIDSSLTLSFFELGDLFAEVKTNGYWRDWKYESFPEYVKKSGVDMSPRQVEYSIVISNVSKALGVNKTLLARAKNSKLKEIFTLDHTSTVTDAATQIEESMADIMRKLVEDAPNKSLKEIKEIVKRLKGQAIGEDGSEPDVAGELTWLNLPVRRDAKQVVVDAIELAMKLSGCTVDAMTKEVKDLSQAAALERICADFTADPNNQAEEAGEEGSFEDESEFSDEEDEATLDADDDDTDDEDDEDADYLFDGEENDSTEE
jgi:hypothetical protein